MGKRECGGGVGSWNARSVSRSGAAVERERERARVGRGARGRCRRHRRRERDAARPARFRPRARSGDATAASFPRGRRARRRDRRGESAATRRPATRPPSHGSRRNARSLAASPVNCCATGDAERQGDRRGVAAGAVGAGSDSRRRGRVRRVARECERESTRRTGRDDGSGPRQRSYCPRTAAGARRPEFRECTQKENFSLVRRGRQGSTFSEKSFFFRVARLNSAKIPTRRATVNSFPGQPGLVYFCILRH